MSKSDLKRNFQQNDYRNYTVINKRTVNLFHEDRWIIEHSVEIKNYLCLDSISLFKISHDTYIYDLNHSKLIHINPIPIKIK